MEPKRRPRVLLNPAAAGGRAGRRLVPLLSHIDAEVREVPCAEAMRGEARRAADEGFDRVLVAGGDGTLHHAIQGLAGSACALGLLPVGSGNDLARALGIERDVVRAARRALAARPRTIDVGRAGDRVFVGVAGVGLDAAVIRGLGAARSRLGARLGYLVATWRALGSFVPPRVRVELEGASWSGRALLVAVANSPVFGGGMRIAPAARLDDGWLDVVRIAALSRAGLVRLLPALYRGRAVHHPAVHVDRARALRIAVEPDWTLCADGELLGPIGRSGEPIEVWPGALRVAV